MKIYFASFLITLFVLLQGCDGTAQPSGKPIDVKNRSTPYQVFFQQLQIPELTDTVLLQMETRVFGCGTAAMQYQRALDKSGLREFYNQYGDVLSDTAMINLFSLKHNVTILWMNRGVEGERFELNHPKMHADIVLEKRLIAQKSFLKFTEEPAHPDSITIYVSVMNPATKKLTNIEYMLAKKGGQWMIINNKQSVVTGKDAMERGYYP